MKKLTFVPAILTFASIAAMAPTAFAAAAAFSEVDIDGDGVLGITEAQTAFPDLLIVDANMDELLNAAEIQSAVPGLELNALEPETATLGEAEYQQIVETLELDVESDAGVSVEGATDNLETQVETAVEAETGVGVDL